MASSSFMNKQTVNIGVNFATNNFVAILDHRDLPSEFHIVHDFLASSPLVFALTEPASVSFKSVMQVWNTLTFDRGHSGSILMRFEYDGVTHYVTPAIVEEALHLPVVGDVVPANVSDSTLFEFVTKLGYNGEVKRFFQLIFNQFCPDVVFEEDVILPICRITENNIKSLVNSDKANGFSGNAFIPDEVRLFLKEKMPTQYGSVSDSVGQGQSHLVPNPSIQPKQSKQSTATSIVSQKTLVVKPKKSARSDVFGRQSGSKDFSSTPLTKKKIQGGVQGVLVKKVAKGVEAVSVKRKLVLRDETDSEDDMPISSKIKMNKEVADTATEVVAPSSKPHKKRKLSKSRYHIPLEKKQDTDGQYISNLDEQSNPNAQATPDVSIPDAAPSSMIDISDSPAKASPTSRILDISWEKVPETASKLGFTHPLDKKRKADEFVFTRQKKLKGSSPQEHEPQSGSAAIIDDPATQEPLNRSLGEGIAIGMVTQEPFSQRENEDISIPATQEPSSQCEDVGKPTVSEEFPDIAQGVSGADEILVEDTVNEGSPQEPLTQSVKAASEPQAPQELSVTNPDECQSNPNGVAPDASGAPDAEPILIQPLSSRPMTDSITSSQDKLKGIAIPDPDVTHDSDADDSDDDNN
ncbi:hypothetical protein POM88_049598 [Heracleum sosnowskyi]|uniref:Uncharacterized protein n=1 Tax=Heracleum sosnowskyi TaxID=360622 RepID=A0AAD8M1Q0_9APIA|nr:hypothetical protein POM88_049598 [Heracleum sosnowskyi]